LRSQFAIRDGRLHLQPFSVSLGGTTMTVAGSNGLDQSLQYNLGLKVPRSLMGGGANEAISGLLSKATSAGVDLGSAAEIPLGIQLGGTIKNPTIKTDLASLPTSVAQNATDAVKKAAEQQVNAQAQKLIGDAEQQANKIRADAQALSDKVKKEGYQQADSLVAKSKDGLAKIAATAAADQLRKETDNRAAQIVREADQQATSLVSQARKQAGVPAPTQ
jgi:AsmA-like C-terminal region